MTGATDLWEEVLDYSMCPISPRMLRGKQESSSAAWKPKVRVGQLFSRSPRRRSPYRAKSQSHLRWSPRSPRLCTGCVCWFAVRPSRSPQLHPQSMLLPTPPVNPLPMSTTNQTAGPSRSADNFKAIFQAALNEYHTVTGKSLDTHPFSTQLDGCDTPEAISNVLRTQAQAFSKSRKRYEKLMAWLDPTVNILFTFSATLGEGIGLVSHVIRRALSFSNIWLDLSHSHPRKRSSRESAFFSQ